MFLVMVDSETGDFRHLLVEGGVLDQPFMTFNILRYIQSVYRRVMDDRRKKLKMKSRS